MSGPPIVGHEELRRDFARAQDTGRLPGSILLHGPAGIGKQRLALWLAQRLVCENPGPIEPCGQCTACHLAARLEHPDIHWFFPVANVSGSRERKVELFEAAREDEIATRRAWRWTEPDGLVGFYLDQITGLRRLAAKRPAMGSRAVYVVGHADRLVSQEASQEAANALLKLLEEPPDGTTFVLTAADPDALLPTIRSRLLPVRVDPLPEEAVAGLLVEQYDVAADRAAELARVARGSAGLALEILGDDDGPGPYARHRDAARALLDAVAERAPTAVVAAAMAESPARARGDFSAVLRALQLWVRDLAAVASGADEEVVNLDAVDWLRATATRLPAAAAGAPAALDALARGLTLAAGNVNPQLILADVLPSLRRTLGRTAAST